MIEGGSFSRAARAHEAAGLGCEDAAITLTLPAASFGALCDGCSSGEDSGFAAKALVRASAASWAEGSGMGRDLACSAWDKASHALRSCGLDPERSPATLLAMEIDEITGAARISCWGDGVVALSDGKTGMLKAAWVGDSALNMPAYPAYVCSEELWDQFERAGGRSVWEPKLSAQALSMGASGRFWEGRAQLEDGDMLMLLSDGVCAIEGRSLMEALGDLSKAKGPGRFMQRRASKALDAWLRSGANLGDDFSVAALRWTREREGALA